MYCLFFWIRRLNSWYFVFDILIHQNASGILFQVLFIQTATRLTHYMVKRWYCSDQTSTFMKYTIGKLGTYSFTFILSIFQKMPIPLCYLCLKIGAGCSKLGRSGRRQAPWTSIVSWRQELMWNEQQIFKIKSSII